MKTSYTRGLGGRARGGGQGEGALGFPLSIVLLSRSIIWELKVKLT